MVITASQPFAGSASAQRQFIDTHVFVCLFDPHSPLRQAKARALVKQCLMSGSGVTSHQVVQEFAHVALNKMTKPMSEAECDQVISELLLPMLRVNFSIELVRNALALRKETGYPWYDSLIVAAAAEARCDVLYTEDLQHGQWVRSVLIQDPFLHCVDEV